MRLDQQLFNAVKNNDLELSAELIHAGANVNYWDEEEDLSVLHQAILNHNLELVKLLVENSSSLDSPCPEDEEVFTSIMMAVFVNNPEIIRYLASQGANVDATINGYFNALHLAIEKEFIEALQALIDYNVNIECKSRTPP